MSVMLTQRQTQKSWERILNQLGYIKLCFDKYHVIVSGTKYEHVWVKPDKDKIQESNKMKLLGFNLGNELKFDKHISSICTKAIKN